MRGMANGMILAVATMEDSEPKFIKAPEKERVSVISEPQAAGDN